MFYYFYNIIFIRENVTSRFDSFLVMNTYESLDLIIVLRYIFIIFRITE